MRRFASLALFALIASPVLAQTAAAPAAPVAPVAPVAPTAPAAIAAPTAPAAPAQVATAAEKPKLICRRDVETGSIVKATKQCHTAQEWQEIRSSAQGELTRSTVGVRTSPDSF